MRAGCACRRPTQWEYALADNGRDRDAVRERSLEWFAEPNASRPRAIGGPANGFGVRDMVGVVWEWTLDFDAYATTAESRDPNGKDSAPSAAARRPARRSDRLSGLHALFDAREPEGELHRRQCRLPLRGRRVMTSVLLAASRGSRLARRRRRRARHATRSTNADTARRSRASVYNLDSKWTTQDGADVALASLGGKPVVAAMGYTTCKDMCPAIVADMMWIDKHLPPDAASRCNSCSSPSIASPTRRSA